MILEENKFKYKLYNILKDLSLIESSDITMQNCIEHKLSRSFEQYQNTIKNIYNYVLSRSNLKVIKAINKVKELKGKNDGNKGS